MTISPHEIVVTGLDSGLRGRGGAGFPVGRKWLTFAGNALGGLAATVVVVWCMVIVGNHPGVAPPPPSQGCGGQVRRRLVAHTRCRARKNIGGEVGVASDANQLFPDSESCRTNRWLGAV